MKIKRHYTSCLMVVLAAGLFVIPASGESTSNDGPEKSIVWGEDREGFSLSIKLKTEKATFDHSVFMTIRIKNTSSEEQLLIETDHRKDYRITVKDSNGKVVPLLRYEKILREFEENTRRVGTKMYPGQIIEYDVNLSRRFDLSLEGKYSVQAERSVLQRSPDGGDPKLVTLKSNTATLTLTTSLRK